MTTDTKALVERLRGIEDRTVSYEIGAAMRDAILALTRGETGSADYARGVGDAAKTGETIIREMLTDLSMVNQHDPEELRRCETCGLPLTIEESAPMEDATLCPKMAFESGPCYSDRVWRRVLLYDLGKKFDLDATAREIMAPVRALTAKETAAEDTLEKEITDHEAEGAMLYRGHHEARRRWRGEPL